MRTTVATSTLVDHIGAVSKGATAYYELGYLHAAWGSAGYNGRTSSGLHKRALLAVQVFVPTEGG